MQHKVGTGGVSGPLEYYSSNHESPPRTIIHTKAAYSSFRPVVGVAFALISAKRLSPNSSRRDALVFLGDVLLLFVCAVMFAARGLAELAFEGLHEESPSSVLIFLMRRRLTYVNRYVWTSLLRWRFRTLVWITLCALHTRSTSAD